MLIGRFSSSSLLLQPPVEISLFFLCFFFSLYLLRRCAFIALVKRYESSCDI